MPQTILAEHSTSQIFKAVQEMVINAGFKWNDDLSDTNVGNARTKYFKLLLTEVENTDRSNRQNFRVKGTFEVALFHNAEGDTVTALMRATEDAENIVFDIERFAPEKFASAKQLVSISHFIRWVTDPIRSGDDSVIKTTIIFEITYIIKNPAAT